MSVSPRFTITPLRAALLICTMALQACGSGDQEALKTWMAQERKSTPASVQKLVAPVPFKPEAYTLTGELDPFDPQKLKAALAKARAASSVGSLQPDVSRRRELLETLPLDSLRMVGFMVRAGKPTALLSAAGKLHSVNVGHYIGMDFGRIVALSERELTLKELVQDGSGDWSERITKVQLQETTKDGKK